MSRPLWLLAGVTLGLGMGASLGAYRWRDPTLSHYATVRARYVKNLIAQSQPVDTLVLGDSISESTLLDGVCGKTFNAAVGGSRIGLDLELARFAIPRLKPRTIIVAIGTTHFANGEDPAFEREYSAFVRQLPARKILVGTPRSQMATAFIERTAQEIGATFVMPVTGKLTFEGVHPTPEGAVVYRSRLAAACRYPLGRVGQAH